MRRSKQMLLAVGLGAIVAGGGVRLAEAGSSSSTAAPSAASKTATVAAGSATVNVTTATVGGKSEQVLVDAKGLPLYTYDADTPTQSHVSGGLAA
jgi:predicted lipoprotein with Yx(FWY)xxD motif